MAIFGVIGVGNIAGAILNGVIQSGYLPANSIRIYDLDPQKTKQMHERHEIPVAENAQDVVRQSDYVLIAVKPGAVENVLQTLSPAVGECCFISVAAGISIAFLEQRLPARTAVFRAMPNTPLMYGSGAVAYAANHFATDAQSAFVHGLFGACGYVTKVEEKMLNAVTAVSGSSPAFIFRFLNAMIREGIAEGLPEADAQALVLHTVIGSSVMFSKSGLSAEELIRMVASPNGTTEAGLKDLDTHHFDETVQSAVRRAYARAVELTK